MLLPACKYNVALRQTDRIDFLQFDCPSLVLLDAAEGGMRMQYGFTTDRRMKYISYNSSVRPWCCWMLAGGRHADAVAVRYDIMYVAVLHRYRNHNDNEATTMMTNTTL